VEKSLLAVGGTTIADRTLALLRRTCADVLVATPRPDPWRGSGALVVPDALPDAGPLAGLAAGLAAATKPWVLAVAGDMPLLDERVLRCVATRALATGRCVIPTWQGVPQPLHAAYRSSDATRAAEALARGVRKVTGWLEPSEVEWLEVEALRGIPRAGRSFTSVNTPEELAALGGLLDAGAPAVQTPHP
jgi:molybdopterin-guanine dinucleotide biosynthesis protein A